jgi:hypothetical protein
VEENEDNYVQVRELRELKRKKWWSMSMVQLSLKKSNYATSGDLSETDLANTTGQFSALRTTVHGKVLAWAGHNTKVFFLGRRRCRFLTAPEVLN